jgi:hypothetical protein
MYLRFTDNVINQIADFTLLKLYVNLKTTFSPLQDFRYSFYNGTTLVSSTVTIALGTYNFLRTTINSYQTIMLISAFSFTSSNFDRVEIGLVNSNTAGFRMDIIVLLQD